MDERAFFEFVSHFYRAHPWHGLNIGDKAPQEVHSYIEIVPTDTVKFELDKDTGLLKADRPQKFSNYCPSLYGLIPQTFAGKRIGNYCSEKIGSEIQIRGDGDPLDICVLTEKPILRGDIMVTAVPIGGIRAVDKDEADDKIIAILKDDLVYSGINDIDECPENLIERLCHYFLTYKESAEELSTSTDRRMKILAIYGREEAQHIINLAREDYDDLYGYMLQKKKN